MKSIELKTTSGCTHIRINESIKNLTNYTRNQKLIIITDQNVNQLHHHLFPSSDHIVIGTGESIKNLKTVESIYQKLLDFEVDRSWMLLGIGGGIVCDISGFVASTYLRGLDFGFVSTTLLAQVDASVGGKNGVNFLGYKNQIGVFNQPQFVICDLALLKTLPREETICGFAEIIKHGLIRSRSLCEFLEKNHQEILELKPEVLEPLIYESILIKSAIVSQDEKEKGQRKLLNFGHTLGHAIEKVHELSHGQAVCLGMLLSIQISLKYQYLSAGDAKRITQLIGLYFPPLSLALDKEALCEAIHHDKKRQKKVIDFILLEGPGKPLIKEIPIPEIEGLIHDLC